MVLVSNFVKKILCCLQYQK